MSFAHPSDPAPLRDLLVATRNSHKTAEFRAMLPGLFDVADLANARHIPEVEETGATFNENATLKALQISRFCDGLVLADDSGLEVDVLNGRPGVYSARFAGPDATDADNRSLLVAELKKVSVNGAGAKARFRCVLVLATQGDVLATSSGTVEGRIILTERGEGGFGYDPLFVPDGYDLTFAELPSEVKNTLSHRARAIEALRPLLSRL